MNEPTDREAALSRPSGRRVKGGYLREPTMRNRVNAGKPAEYHGGGGGSGVYLVNAVYFLLEAALNKPLLERR